MKEIEMTRQKERMMKKKRGKRKMWQRRKGKDKHGC